MKKYIFWQNTSFVEALALTIISVSLVTSNYYQLLTTESDISQKQSQTSSSTPKQSK